MSLGPDKVHTPIDLFMGPAGTSTGGAVTSTGAGLVFSFPPGKKAIQYNNGTSTAVATVKIQNSCDGVTWFDVTSASASNGSTLAEMDTVVPKWRVNITGMTTAATAASPFVAIITIPPT